MKIVAIVVLVAAVLAGGVFGLMKAGIVPGLRSTHRTKSAKAKAAEIPTVTVSPSPEREPTGALAPTRPKAATSAPVQPLDPLARAENDRKMARLASVYEAMPAAQVQPILAKLPDPLVKDLFRLMDERQVGKLLVSMAPERAAKLTRELAK